MFEGFLKFTPDLTALIRYDEKTEKTDKAVYIDAEGNETPICSGGGSEYEVVEVEITNTSYDVIAQVAGPLMQTGQGETGTTGLSDSFSAGDTITISVIKPVNDYGYCKVLHENLVFTSSDPNIIVEQNKESWIKVAGSGSVEVVEGII